MPQPIGKTTKNASMGTGCIILFLLPFAAVGVIVAGMLAGYVFDWSVARSWIEVPCQIDRTELKESYDGDGGTTYRVEADYRYKFGNQEYRSSRVDFGRGSDNIGRFHADAHAELQRHQSTGQPFQCFVDPAHPAESVLYRDLRVGVVILDLLLVAVFGGIGIGGLLGIRIGSRKTRRMNEVAAMSPNEPWLWDTSTTSGEYFPTPAWIGWTLMAVIWNAISWPFVYLTLANPNGREFGGHWFVILFPPIGLYFAFSAIRGIRQRLFYGKPLLKIAPLAIHHRQYAERHD